MGNPFLYDTNEDRSQRLNGTFCRLGGSVVYIEYSSGFIFTGTMLDKKGAPINLEVDIRDEAFSAVPFSLGWVNITGSLPIYVSRNASRQSKQGTNSRNLTAFNTAGNGVPFGRSILADLRVFSDLVSGNYPSFTEAIKVLRDSNAVAIARDICLVKDEIGIVKIKYHTETIGWYSKSEGVCRIPETSPCVWYEKFLSKHSIKVEKGVDG